MRKARLSGTAKTNMHEVASTSGANSSIDIYVNTRQIPVHPLLKFSKGLSPDTSLGTAAMVSLRELPRKSYLRGKRYRSEKKAAHRPKNGKGPHSGDLKGKTLDRLAKEYGVGSTTIERDASFSEDVDKIAENVGEEAKS